MFDAAAVSQSDAGCNRDPVLTTGMPQEEILTNQKIAAVCAFACPAEISNQLAVEGT